MTNEPKACVVVDIDDHSEMDAESAEPEVDSKPGMAPGDERGPPR